MIDPLFTKAAIDIVSAFIKKRINDRRNESVRTVGSGIEQHLREALTWSSRVQFYGMSQAEETETATIALKLQAEPRRFRSVSATAQPRDENDLLGDSRSYLLLGDPGAGKTTTIKRLVRTILLEPATSIGDDFQIPIVIRLRELDSPLVPALAIAVGIPFEGRGRIEKDGLRTIQRMEYWCENIPLEQVVIEFLNSTQAVLFLDGLDEVPGNLRKEVHRELERLALSGGRSKVIASCRTGDYTNLVEGFDLVEICPLTPEQITQIAEAWVRDPAEFEAHLSRVPYRDLADRPLFLTQLLFLFNRYGYLPEQPCQVYRKVIALLLHEWDAERNIVRSSKYAGFDADRKAAFLAALSHYLTYQSKQKIFTARHLEDAYLDVRDRFGLPEGEARDVVAEIETHTGILVAVTPSSFEFSHLSLQEYLCAEYLIREPFSEHLSQYMLEYSAPVAVAVSLSSNPSAWLAGIVLRSRFGFASQSLRSFVARLILERPYFGLLDALGVAIMKLYRDMSGGDPTATDVVDAMLQLPNVAESVDAGLQCYGVSRNLPAKEGFVRLERRLPLQGTIGFPTPDLVSIPAKVLQCLADTGGKRAQELLVAIEAQK